MATRCGQSSPHGLTWYIPGRKQIGSEHPTTPNLEDTMEITGIGGLIILIADIYAIVMILQSSAKSVEKLIWALVVLLLPLIGVVVWYLAGPGKKPF